MPRGRRLKQSWVETTGHPSRLQPESGSPALGRPHETLQQGHATQPPIFHLDTGPQGQGPRKQPQGFLPTDSLPRDPPGAPAPPSLQHLLPSDRAPDTGSKGLRWGL